MLRCPAALCRVRASRLSPGLLPEEVRAPRQGPARLGARPPRLWGPSAARDCITVTTNRLAEFVEAEIAHFAANAVEQVKLTHILGATTPLGVAALIHKHLPGHFATRIKSIEGLPGWSDIQEFVKTRDILTTSFRELRLVENSDDLEALTKVVQSIRQRHRNVIPLLSTAMAELRANDVMSEEEGNDWLDKFLRARISTEMLTSHYVAMLRQTKKPDQDGHCTGIVDTRCNPGEICQQVANEILDNDEYHDVVINVDSYACTASQDRIEFSFLPQYLSLLIRELLRNSAQATILNRMEKGTYDSGDKQKDAIRIIVGADQRQVIIAINDRGGGIPSSEVDRIWNYPWSSTWEGEDQYGVESFQESWADPLSGLSRQRLGMGIPLIRLYTEYLGGSIELMSLPGIGVDVYLKLRRIDITEPGAADSLAEPSRLDSLQPP